MHVAPSLPAPPAFGPPGASQSIPLSYAQQRLWFLEHLHPGTGAYNVLLSLIVRGPLDLRALASSLNELIRRHAILRTSFPSREGQPEQLIWEPMEMPLQVVDLRQVNPGELEARIEDLRVSEGSRPFDLEAAPLFRTTLVKTSGDEHHLFLACHHLIWDLWSGGVLYDELSQLYAGFRLGHRPQLPELRMQYADFARWQREYLEGPRLRKHLAYWRDKLARLQPLRGLSSERALPLQDRDSGETLRIELSYDLTRSLEQLARKTNATLFMVLLATFKVLLLRLTGQEDIAVGAPIANRNRLEIENLVGLFVNPLVLRTDLGGNPTFRELLTRVRETALNAYAHQDVPFEKLVEELNPDRDLSSNPFVNIMFNFRNVPMRTLELEGLKVEPYPRLHRPLKILLTLYITNVDDRLLINMVYSPDLLRSEQAACVLDQYAWLLEQVLSGLDTRLDRFSLVTPRMQNLLPDPRADLPRLRQKPVTALFKEVAHAHAHKDAVADNDRAWTYEQLSGAADHIARALVARRLAPGQIVAVPGPASFGFLASIVGVLQAGGVLLLLDPRLPDERQKLMLKESGAAFVVAADSAKGTDAYSTVVHGDRVLRVGAESGRVEGAPDHISVELPCIEPDLPAYVFFTSGSSGQPKGILGDHAGLSHFINWQRTEFCVDHTDRVAQLTGLSFDVVLREIFLPLTSGATLCLRPEGLEVADTNTLSWLAGQKVSLIHAVPSVVEAWLAQIPSDASLSRLRCVFFAGEPLHNTLVNRWRAAFPDSGRLINLYGPTETTLAKCFYAVPDIDPQPGIQPIGTPLPDTQVLIMKGDYLCGPGETGEIVIRTPFRTRGYLHDQELDSGKFVPNPWSNDPSDLLYRTGDQGRYRFDGLLEILGRTDFQIKIRGQRVEPAEIEAVLNQHELVGRSVVRGHKKHGEETFLVAYLTTIGPRQPTNQELRAHLKSFLPPFMIPSVFMVLDEMPITANGKLDSSRLPTADRTRTSDGTRARNVPYESERRLMEVWRRILGVESIGLDDDFFELGGHSILAVQMLSQVYATFQVRLPVRALFEYPTVRACAARIEELKRQELAEAREIGGWRYLTPIQPHGSKPPIYLVPGGLGTDNEFLIYANLVRRLGADQPVFGLKSQIADGVSPAHRDVNEMARDYVAEIRTLQPRGPYSIVGGCVGSVAAFEMARVFEQEGDIVALLALIDGQYTTTARFLKGGLRRFLRSKYLRELPREIPHALKIQKYEMSKMPWRRWPAYVKTKVSTFFDEVSATFFVKTKTFILTEMQRKQLAYVKALRRYRPGPYGGGVTLLLSSDFQRIAVASQWKKWVRGDIEIVHVPGTHLSSLREEVEGTVEQLRNCIERARH